MTRARPGDSVKRHETYVTFTADILSYAFIGAPSLVVRLGEEGVLRFGID